MTTSKAILIGLTFIAVAIASIPYSNNVVTPAYASLDHLDHRMIKSGIQDIVSAIYSCN